MTEFDDGYDSRSFRDPGRDMDNMVAQNAINIMQQMGVDFAPRNQRVNQDWQRQDDFYSQANGNGDYRYSQNQGPVDWRMMDGDALRLFMVKSRKFIEMIQLTLRLFTGLMTLDVPK